MTGRIRTTIAIAATTGLLVVAAGAAAWTGEPPPPGMTAQQYRAELIRGDALDQRYHLGKYSLAAQSGPRPAGMTSQQWQAELIRADALDKRYGLGRYAGTVDASSVSAPEASQVVSTASDGFDWGSAGIGAGAAVGLGLLASAMAVGLRQSRRAQVPTTS
jgi:hypothetical protein